MVALWMVGLSSLLEIRQTPQAVPIARITGREGKFQAYDSLRKLIPAKVNLGSVTPLSDGSVLIPQSGIYIVVDPTYPALRDLRAKEFLMKRLSASRTAVNSSDLPKPIRNSIEEVICLPYPGFDAHNGGAFFVEVKVQTTITSGASTVPVTFSPEEPNRSEETVRSTLKSNPFKFSEVKFNQLMTGKDQRITSPSYIVFHEYPRSEFKPGAFDFSDPEIMALEKLSEWMVEAHDSLDRSFMVTKESLKPYAAVCSATTISKLKTISPSGYNALVTEISTRSTGFGQIDGATTERWIANSSLRHRLVFNFRFAMDNRESGSVVVPFL